MILNDKYALLNYFAETNIKKGKIPTIPELSKELGVSQSSIREQLAVARSLGLVEVKPKIGIQTRPFSLEDTINLGLQYGMKVQPELFDYFSDLRKHVELSYWYEAVPSLTNQDIFRLQQLVTLAKQMISEQPVKNPEIEHRRFHTTIFKRLKNTVVRSILETYWDLYDLVEPGYILERSYLDTVWNYHELIVNALKAREFEKGYEALLTHMDLIKYRKRTEISQRFE